MSEDPWSNFDTRAGLLVDTGLLVLLVVGSVNPRRIEAFKRTSKYTRADYELLCRLLDRFSPLYTLTHIMAEVSSLTDLTGTERLTARLILKELLKELTEPQLSSAQAAQGALYDRLGLVDAAISAVAKERECAVLTDDLDLYVALLQDGLPVLNFTHLRGFE
jgi:hypothetical protein